MIPLILFLLFGYFSTNSFQNIFTISVLSEVRRHLLIASKVSGKNLTGVPSRELNSGLPYARRHTTDWVTPHLFEPSCSVKLFIIETLKSFRRTYAIDHFYYCCTGVDDRADSESHGGLYQGGEHSGPDPHHYRQVSLHCLSSKI